MCLQIEIVRELVIIKVCVLFYLLEETQQWKHVCVFVCLWKNELMWV